MNENLWLLNDDPNEGVLPVHHHSGDDMKDFLMDASTGEVLSEREANESTMKRLGITGRPTTRRTMLKGAMAAGAATFLAPSLAPRYAFAAGPTHTLVNIFLRGGIDGLNVLGPFQDAAYLAKRKTAIVDPAKGATQLNGTFALNAAMAPLLGAWNNGHLSFAHAVGMKDQIRSHFVDQARAERCAPVTARTGWLGRYLMEMDPVGSDYMSSVSISPSLVDSMSTGGSRPVFSTASMKGFTITAGPTGLFAQSVASGNSVAGGPLGAAATGTIDAMRQVAQYTTVTPQNGAVYSNTAFGIGLSQIAQVIKSGANLRVAAIDLGSWDTHTNEVNIMNTLMGTLAKDLQAFYTDLGTLMSKVSVITQSEFGRTTVENASSGCDHGFANFVMCLSGMAAPKTIAGPWPGLSPSAADAQGDLVVATDHRDIMGEVLSKTMGATPDILSRVFPDYTPTPRGILR